MECEVEEDSEGVFVIFWEKKYKRNAVGIVGVVQRRLQEKYKRARLASENSAVACGVVVVVEAGFGF
jgi:hypothetical protein